MIKLDVIEASQRELMDPKAIARVERQALQAVAEEWHRRYLPFHFEPFAGAKYGYQQRTRKHIRRKAARGIKNALTFSGALARAAKAPPRVGVSKAGVRLTMRGLPDYIVVRRRDKEARARIFAGALRQGASFGDAAVRAGVSFDYARLSAVYIEIAKRPIGRGPLDAAAMEKAMLAAMREPAQYPNIRQELTRTLASEANSLARYYSENGKKLIDAAAARTPTRRRKLT